jgi:hypothetical protein
MLIKSFTKIGLAKRMKSLFCGNAEAILLISPILILFILIAEVALGQVHLFTQNIDNATGFISAILTVTGTVFAITMSITFLALELSSHFYTLRLIPFFARHPYFIAMLIFYVGTISYAGIALRDVASLEAKHLDCLLLLFIFDILLLVLYLVFFCRNLHPANPKVTKHLCRKLSLKETVNAVSKEINLFEPINEVVAAAIGRRDFETAKKCVQEVGISYAQALSDLTSPPKWKAISGLVAGNAVSCYYITSAFDKYIGYGLKEKEEDFLIQIARTLTDMIDSLIKGNTQVSVTEQEHMNTLNEEIEHVVERLKCLREEANRQGLEKTPWVVFHCLEKLHAIIQPYQFSVLDGIEEAIQDNRGGTDKEGGSH